MSDCCCAEGQTAECGKTPLDWFQNMVEHSLNHVKSGKDEGRKLAGITCEYTPRELILAAGGMPVCLCGGFAQMIPPAEKVLPTNLCPLIKSTYGFHVEKANPFLEMADLLVAETTCDGKKKMFELLAEERTMHVLELTQKSDDPDAFEHWYREIVKLKEELETRWNVTISDDDLREAIRVMNRERDYKRELSALMSAVQPPLSGRELLDMRTLVAGMPDAFEQYDKAMDFLKGRQGVNDGTACRVLLTGVPVPHGAEKVVDLIEQFGGLIVCQENCTGVKPVLEDVDADAENPLRAIAEKYFHLPCSVMTDNQRRIDSLRSLVAQYRPDCIVDLIWQTCVTYDVETHYVRRLAQELKLPYLRIETDYSPSDTESLTTRIEALFETVKERHVHRD